jgi:polyhydroxybutyrate depolymerase
MGGQAHHALVDYGWAALARREGFIAVGLEALPLDHTRAENFATNPRYWNAGSAGSKISQGDNVDDVRYARDVLADVERRYKVDLSRIYATGMSNGAGMTNRLGDEMPKTFAAIAPVAGNNWAKEPLSSPLHVLMIFGRADKLVPIDGGAVKLQWGEAHQEAPRVSADKWAKLLACGEPTTRKSGALERTDWAGCREGASLEMIVVDGLGHVWPGLVPSDLPVALAGPPSAAYDATTELWAYFKTHRRGAH